MKFKRCICMIAVLVISFTVGLSASAHYRDSFSESGGESKGWAVSPLGHNANWYVYYSMDSNDKYLPSYRSIIAAGATKWYKCVNVSEYNGSAASGMITTVASLTEGDVVAQVVKSYTDSRNHWGWWTMQLNRSKSIGSDTIAHEFGHVIGLDDLYSSSNRDKLMYYTLGTASYPGASDTRGARIVTGRD